MVKKRIHLNESKLKGIIRESVKRILNESGYNQFSDYDFASVDPYSEGFDDNAEYGDLDGSWTFNGAYVNISDRDGVVEFEIEPRCEGCKGSFKIVGEEADELKGDIEECAKECGDVSLAICKCVRDMIGDGRLNEKRLNRVIRESINEVLAGELDDDDVVDYMRGFDDEEEGEVFNVSQYKVTLGGTYHGPEKILNKSGLSKEEAWEVFKEAAEYACKYDWKSVHLYGTKDYIEWPVVSTEVDGILGRRRVFFPEGGGFEIANAIERAKEMNNGERGYRELCDGFLRHAKETFFSGKYEYHSW